MKCNLEELKTLIIHRLDVVDLLDLLSIDIADLVEVLEEQIEENWEEVVKAVK